MSNDTKTITIQGVMATVSQPYAEGHTITEAEAKALNQVRAENIANNKRREIKEMLEAEGATPESVAKDVQKIVSAYDAEYVFTLASVSTRKTVDPLEKMARKIARDAISAKLKELGKTQKEYLAEHGDDAINSKIAELSEHPQVIEAAKAALKESEKLAGINL